MGIKDRPYKMMYMYCYGPDSGNHPVHNTSRDGLMGCTKGSLHHGVHTTEHLRTYYLKMLLPTGMMTVYVMVWIPCSSWLYGVRDPWVYHTMPTYRPVPTCSTYVMYTLHAPIPVPT